MSYEKDKNQEISDVEPVGKLYIDVYENGEYYLNLDFGEENLDFLAAILYDMNIGKIPKLAISKMDDKYAAKVQLIFNKLLADYLTTEYANKKTKRNLVIRPTETLKSLRQG